MTKWLSEVPSSILGADRTRMDVGADAGNLQTFSNIQAKIELSAAMRSAKLWSELDFSTMSELKRGLFPRRRAKSQNQQEPIDGDKDGVKKSRLNGRFRRTKKKKKKRKRILTLAVLPTLLTLGNAVCGLAAIAIAISEDFAWPEYQLIAVGVLIFGGMLFDALDGSAARMTHQESEFGAELDSLCDAVTFGTAPAILIWKLSDAFPHRYSWGIGVLFTLCVLIRLARFNVETDEDDTHEGFEGLPSPAAAGTIAAFAIGLPELKSFATDPQYPDWVQTLAMSCDEASKFFIPALALMLAYLMVSRFQYPHVVQQWIRGRQPLHQVGQAMFAVLGIFAFHWLALPMILVYYALASPIKSLMRPARNDDDPSLAVAGHVDATVAVEDGDETALDIADNQAAGE